jgi:hypothetical protein
VSCVDGETPGRWILQAGLDYSFGSPKPLQIEADRELYGVPGAEPVPLQQRPSTKGDFTSQLDDQHRLEAQLERRD